LSIFKILQGLAFLNLADEDILLKYII